MIKKHITECNSLTNENWKAFELAWKLKTNGGFSEEEWTTQIDGDISVIVNNSARPSLSSQHASTPTATQATKTTTVSCVSSTSNPISISGFAGDDIDDVVGLIE